MSTTVVPPPLNQAAGYGVIIGLGALFAIGVVFVARSLVQFAGYGTDNEEYAVAKRSVGSGMIGAAVISSWTWSTTLLSSCSTAYNYGVSGPLFYAAGNSTQIVLFANLAIQLKRKAPNAHTYLELIRARYGTFAHLSFMFFSLATNILVVSSVLLGGCAAIASITGMNIYAALWLMPLTVAAYTIRGGLRSTILADFAHTWIIFVIIIIFFIRTYATSPDLGSPSKVFDLLTSVNPQETVSGNQNGSFLTIKSDGGVKFAVLSFLEYTGVVFLDASYHQKGVASRPDATVRGYFIGGLSWFSIPFCLATTMGLAALALEHSPVFPTYPRRMTTDEVSAGLVLPYAAQALLGKGGAAAVLLLMVGYQDKLIAALIPQFMSCTSAISAQLIAVSTVYSYDIYKTYFNIKATQAQLLRHSEYGVIGCTIFMAAFASLLHGVNLDLGFIYNMTGIFTGAAVPILVGTFFSSRQPVIAATLGPWLGFVVAVAVWLGSAYRISGEVNLTTIGTVDVCLYGCAAGMGTTLLLTLITSTFFPQHFDWSTLGTSIKAVNDKGQEVDISLEEGYDPKKLTRSLKLAALGGAIIFLSLFIIWPFSLFGTGYIFSKRFFEGWVVVSFIWAIFAFIAVGFYPIWEGRKVIAIVFKGLYTRSIDPKAKNQGNNVKTASISTTDSTEAEAEATLPEKQNQQA